MPTNQKIIFQEALE